MFRRRQSNSKGPGPGPAVEEESVDEIKRNSWNLKLDAWLMTRGPTATVWVLFILGTIVMFWWGVVDEYQNGKDGFHQYTTVIARGFGYTINFHIVLVIVFATRSFMTLLRKTPLNLVFPFDEAMPKFHAGVGIIIVVSAGLHGIFHVVPGVIDNSWSPGFGGWTFSVSSGICLFIIFFVMYITARQPARTKAFERFYYIHITGAILGMIVLILHAKLRGILYTYKWVTAPLIVYIIDRIYRKGYESLSFATASGSKVYSGNIYRLRVPKTFEYKAGQYAEIKVPSISKLQWHPFTIASAPHEKYISFYIKEIGDWTKELKQKLQALEKGGKKRRGQGLKVLFRGPYGAPSEHVGQFESIVLISGGIGATPFLSIVKDAVHYITNNSNAQPPKSEARKKMKKFVAPHSSVTLTNEDAKSMRNYASSRPSRDSRDGFASDSSESHEIPDRRVPDRSIRSREVPGREVPDREVSSRATLEGGSPLPVSLDRSSFGPPSQDRRSLGRLSRERGALGTAEASSSVEDLSHLGMSSTDLKKLMEAEETPRPRNITESDMSETDDDVGAIPDFNYVDEDPMFWINNVTRARHIVSGLSMSYIIHWVALTRFFLTMVAAATYLGLDLESKTGFHVLPVAFQKVDFALAFIIFVQAFAAIILDVWVKKKISVFDTVVSIPVLFAPVVLHILYFLQVASDYNSVYQEIFFYVLWPLTALVVLVRHFKVVGEYCLLASSTDNSHTDTQSLDFVYTTPTAESDQWLLDELAPLATSPHFRMHRFLTREKPDEENQQTGVGRFVNNYGRPDWDDIFEKIVGNTPSNSFVGIFFCGPKPMELVVREAAAKATYRSREQAWKYRGVQDPESSLIAKGCSVRLVVKAENFG